MTLPEVDQELERLFSVTREATAPDPAARDRIRVGLTPRLGSSASGTHASWSHRPWLAIGLGLLGLCAVSLSLMGDPPAPAKDVGAPSASRPAASAAATHQAIPPATTVAVAAPPLGSPPLDAPPRAGEAVRPAPPPAASKPAPSSVRNADPAEELALVRAMQQALRAGNADAALALAADHARRFPRGTLLEEREGVRAVAQCRLAAPAARPAILNAFVHRFASSPYGARVKAACQ